MSRSRKGNRAVNVELFPFLAVLMCTMGALILLLVSIARNSAQQAQAAALAASGTNQAELDAARTNLLSRAAMLEQNRDMTAAELARRQQELADLDEQSRRLRQELAELEAALANQKPPTEDEDEALKARIAQLQRLIADTAAKLQAARAAVDESANAFAIVPYLGPNGTRRRPIYIECLADRVILQPEGIVLSEADFPENTMSLNPLSSAVQVAANYYERLAPAGEVEDPYPLLLVRPNGIGAYYAARAALKSWDSEFGYEFVEQDWQLRYDPANPRLADMQKLAVQDARAKQRLMALANSGREKNRSSGFRVAGSGGGMVRDDNGQPVKRPPGGGFGGGEYGGTSANRGGSGNFSMGDEQGDGDYGSPSSTNGRYASNEGNSLDAASGRNGGGRSGQDNGILSGNGGGQGQGSSPGNARSLAGQPSGTALDAGRYSGTQATSGGTADGNGEDGTPAGNGSPSGNPGSQMAGGGGKPGEGGQPGAASGGAAGGSPDAAAGPPGTQTLQFGQQSKSGAPSGQAVRRGEYQEQLTREERRKLQSMAQKRGKNWALPDTPGAISVTRPIRIQCAADHLEIVPERRSDRGIRRIDLGPETEDAVPELVTGISQQLDNWGIAGKGMYWRPTLQVEVQPGGEQRFQELSDLLEGSGVTVVEKRANARNRR